MEWSAQDSWCFDDGASRDSGLGVEAVAEEEKIPQLEAEQIAAHAGAQAEVGREWLAGGQEGLVAVSQEEAAEPGASVTELE